MSYDELNEVWNTQKPQSVSQARAQQWLDQARKRHLLETALLTIALIIGLSNIALQSITIAMDSERTVWISSINLALSLIPFVCAMIATHHYIRERKEHEAMGDNLKTCLTQLIDKTETEIRHIRRGLPLFCLGILGLVILSKWQTQTVGIQNKDGDWGGVIVATGIMIIAGAVMYHRMNAFLRPRLNSMRSTLQRLEA